MFVIDGMLHACDLLPGIDATFLQLLHGPAL
jgi:hypothetical protein